MSSKMKIQLYQPINQDLIDAFLTSTEPFEIDVDYMGETSTIDLNDYSTGVKNAIKTVVDAVTFGFEAGAFVFHIIKDGPDFDLSESYLRNRQDTSGTLTDLDDATPLMMRVEIPGFSQNQFRDVIVYYNQAFNPADVDLLEEIGVTLTGDGLNFSIAALTQCKVSFYKPDLATQQYVINYDKSNEIIEP